MKKLLIFGGTSEEHALLRALSRYPAALTLCVASDYGSALLPEENGRLTVRAGRLDAGRMTELMRGEGFSAVVDATHPYAVEVTRNIRRAARDTDIPYLRLLRERSDTDGAVTVGSADEAAALLIERTGNVLLTTGSKELGAYTVLPDYRERLYPRVLPTAASLEACLAHGYKPSHIIAMHGPFSRELNAAMMRQLNIETVVTKDGGGPGGFSDKLDAARELGAGVIVIGRPAGEDEGFPPDKIVDRLVAILEDKS